MRTLIVGAFPKPQDLALPDWFQSGDSSVFDPQSYQRAAADAATAAQVERARRQCYDRQVQELGLDYASDGEMAQDNYINPFCRLLEGIDFERLATISVRNGASQMIAPRVIGPVKLHADTQLPAPLGDRHKIAFPGPLTVQDSTQNLAYVGRETELLWDLAAALRATIERAVALGYGCIQVDEPILARKPEHAELGARLLEHALQPAAAAGATTVCHMCCGYPDHCDQPEYQKADPGTYASIAHALEAHTPSLHIVSLEDAHRHNSQATFDAWTSKTLALGVVDVARSRVESAAEIVERVRAIQFPRERLILATDCGLGLLDEATAWRKLQALAQAARLLAAE